MQLLRITFFTIWFSLNCLADIPLERKVYSFDAGGIESIAAEGSVILNEKQIYGPESGYGWTVKPAYAFQREKFKRSRNVFTIDGVTGKEISFKADLPPGKWHLTIWIEAGFEDSSTTEIIVNNKNQKLNWQIFSPSSEPRTEIQKIYRVFKGDIHIDNSLELKAASRGDSIRLLGFTLIPKAENLNDEQQSILDEIRNTGKYSSGKNLGEIQQKLKQLLGKNPQDPFLVYWDQQVEFMIDAEYMLETMGWEWATKKTGMGIFDRYYQAVMIFDAIINEQGNPFYERALWKRSKILYWLDLESGIEHEKAVGSKGIKELRNQYPEDKLLAMYDGEKINMPDPCDSLKPSPNAPLWSKLQYEALCRLRQEINWWIEVRQAENGEFGGKLGDDVELLRGWPAAVLAGDTTVLYGWKKLADCVWESPSLYKGYSKKVYDVEHASEFISDTTPELVFYTDEEKYIDRLKYSADYFKDFWTGIAENKERYFKSAWFSSTEIDTAPPKNRDVEMNTRAVKAVRYYAWKTGNDEVINYLHQWAVAWLKSAVNTDKEKPEGIFPASVGFPSSEINGTENNWYNANMYWDYFDWKHNAGTKMLDQLLFTYLLTGDSALLIPMKKSLKLISRYDSINTENVSLGSEGWAAAVLKSKKAFWNSVEQYRYITGDGSYDGLILKYGTPYSKYRLSGSTGSIEETLKDFIEYIGCNAPLRTSEVLHTDRVYYPGADNIKAMLTGDGTYESTSPYYAVSWENTDSCFTVLVSKTGTKDFSAQIFSHSNAEQMINMRLWQLNQGSYSLIKKDGNGKVETYSLEIKKRGERVKITIPSKNLITVSIKPL